GGDLDLEQPALRVVPRVAPRADQRIDGDARQLGADLREEVAGRVVAALDRVPHGVRRERRPARPVPLLGPDLPGGVDALPEAACPVVEADLLGRRGARRRSGAEPRRGSPVLAAPLIVLVVGAEEEDALAGRALAPGAS